VPGGKPLFLAMLTYLNRGCPILSGCRWPKGWEAIVYTCRLPGKAEWRIHAFHVAYLPQTWVPHPCVVLSRKGGNHNPSLLGVLLLFPLPRRPKRFDLHGAAQTG